LRRSSWLAAAPPTVAVEIASRRVTVVGLGTSPAGPVVSAQASESLPEGAVVPGLSAGNIQQPEAVASALARALQRSGLGSTRRAALVIPDSVARVSLLHLETVPNRPDDLDQLINWQIRKATPFSIDDAQVSHYFASRDGDTATVAAVVARRDVVLEYERIASAAGIHTGLVDLASFNVMNAIIGAGTATAGDWLFVHLAAEATTLAILRRDALLFYRHRTAVDEEPLGALVHQTAMYHEDRLAGAAFAKVWLSGGGAGTSEARAEIGARLGVPVTTVDVRAAAGLPDRADPSADLLDALAAPVGILIRDRRAA